MPYAKALANGEADLNRCPPGGESTIAALSALLNLPVKPVDPGCGSTIERHIASIHPQHCIGCTLCIKACPVDAIVGSSKRRHAVIAELCTGCELCIPPCPVDCIDMVFMPVDYLLDRFPQLAALSLPTMIRSRAQAGRVSASPAMRDLTRQIEAAGVVILADSWIPGAYASRQRCVQVPAE